MVEEVAVPAVDVAKRVLGALSITRIVIVDDEYSDSRTSVEDFIGICSELGAEAASEIVGVRLSEDLEIQARQIRETWEQLGEDDRELVLRRATEKSAESDGVDSATLGAVETTVGETSAEPTQDSQAATVVEDFLAQVDTCSLETLSLAEWKARSENLLNDEHADGTVFLFDRDLSREGGSKDEGFKLLQAVLARTENAYCGVLTHTVGVQDEYEKWKDLSERHGVAPDRFVLISKGRLADSEAGLVGFVLQIRLAALAGRCADLKTRAWKVFKSSLKEAQIKLDALNVYDFEETVLRSSRREGVWEAETLFRVFSVLMRREARDLMYADSELAECVKSTRRLNVEVPTSSTAPPRGVLGWQLQRFEMYELASFLNQYHIPIEAGDLFEAESSEGPRHYVLLEQPCDLMVREDGKRSHDTGSRRRATLVPVRPSVDDPTKERFAKLKLYDEATGLPWYADFAKGRPVRLAVLDLCVFNSDGKAVWSPDESSSGVLIAAWEKRRVLLNRLFTRKFSEYDQVKNAPQVSEVLAERMLPQAYPFRLAIADRSISYSVKRTGRLRQPFSGAILTQFSRFQSRAAFDHDLEPIANSA